LGPRDLTIPCFQRPGYPTITAPRYPLPPGKAYYEGKGLPRHGKPKLIGRRSQYGELASLLTDILGTDILGDAARGTAIAISGIGRIGYFTIRYIQLRLVY